MREERGERRGEVWPLQVLVCDPPYRGGERDFFIDNLRVRIHSIIVIRRQVGGGRWAIACVLFPDSVCQNQPVEGAIGRNVHHSALFFCFLRKACFSLLFFLINPPPRSASRPSAPRAG